MYLKTSLSAIMLVTTVAVLVVPLFQADFDLHFSISGESAALASVDSCNTQRGNFIDPMSPPADLWDSSG